MSGWLNTPVAIVENDASLLDRLFALSGITNQNYRRTISWITTRYVGCDYNGAKTWRDALLNQYPPSGVITAPTIEASIQPASGGQYHVVAVLKTMSAWTLEV